MVLTVEMETLRAVKVAVLVAAVAVVMAPLVVRLLLPHKTAISETDESMPTAVAAVVAATVAQVGVVQAVAVNRVGARVVQGRLESVERLVAWWCLVMIWVGPLLQLSLDRIQV